MEFTDLDVLVVAPHPDDAELGMGGGILRLLKAGKRVGVLDLTNGEPTPHGSPELRAEETAAATETSDLELVPSRHLHCLGEVVLKVHQPIPDARTNLATRNRTSWRRVLPQSSLGHCESLSRLAGL